MEGGETVGGNPGRLDAMRPPMPCWAVFKEGHITHDGKLSACYLIVMINGQWLI